MEIEYSIRSRQDLRDIKEHIAKDKYIASNNFTKELKQQIINIMDMPYKHRKSKYTNKNEGDIDE
jgi:plasmid stabilization system protein ParE